MPKNVLVIGSGGREHAIAWKLSQSKISNLYVAPGNAGTWGVAENVPIKVTDVRGLAKFAEKHLVDLTVVGPDAPLALGIVDYFQKRGLKIFGPTKAAAQIESSKIFAKELMREKGIPTASFQAFKGYDQALNYIRKRGAPMVVKASGLALGRGVYICRTLAEAESALKKIMLERAHKDAGNEVVIEDFLKGQEISIHVFCDGKTHILFPPAQDHKLIYDGDQGRNTGGMGIITPVPWLNVSDLKEIEWQVVSPVLKSLSRSGRTFMGCLYPGLKMTDSGLKVLEFNARFGDPETQSYMRLLKTDLLSILEACVDGKLDELSIKWHSGFAVCIIIASGGYPGEYKKNIPIYGVNQAQKIPGVLVFHAGTKFTDQLRTDGGRVLGVTAKDKTLSGALIKAYDAVYRIHFDGMHYRKDIGLKSLEAAR